MYSEEKNWMKREMETHGERKTKSETELMQPLLH